MSELLKVYPKDISMVIEIPLKEMEALLDYMERATILFDGSKEPEFKLKADIAAKILKEFDSMADSVRNYGNAS